MSSLAGLKRKYKTQVVVKKAKKATSWGQGKFVRAHVRKNKGPELKVIDTATAGYAVDAVGSVTFINGAAQGTDFNQCIGRKYTNKVVQVTGYVQPVDANTGANKCKILVIYDEQPNGAVPLITDIFTTSSSIAFMNLNNRDRFKVVAEWEETLGAFDTTATQAYAQSPTVANVNIYRKVDLPTIRNGAATTAAITNYNTGSLLLVTIGSETAALGSTAFLATRVRFEDD